MSALGHKRTLIAPLKMSAFGGKADMFKGVAKSPLIAKSGPNVSEAQPVQRTSLVVGLSL